MFGIELSSEVLLGYAVQAVTALLVLLGGLLVASWVSGSIRRVSERSSVDPTLSRFFAKIARSVIMLITALFVLGEFGIQTASFAVILGSAGLAVGLALQGTLANLASGVMLLLFRPFKVGDFVRAGGESGTVHEIDLFTTILDTPDNRRLILPNGAVFSGTIENVSYHPRRRVDVAVGVDYSAPIAETRNALEVALSRVEHVLEDPSAAVVLTDLGASSVDWVVRAWATRENYWAVKEALTRSIKQSLDEVGIGIPFPQMDVHLDGSLQRVEAGNG